MPQKILLREKRECYLILAVQYTNEARDAKKIRKRRIRFQRQKSTLQTILTF